MTRANRFLSALVLAGATAWAQTEPRYLEDILKEEILAPGVAQFQLRQYILHASAPVSFQQPAGEVALFLDEGFENLGVVADRAAHESLSLIHI